MEITQYVYKNGNCLAIFIIPISVKSLTTPLRKWWDYGSLIEVHISTEMDSLNYCYRCESKLLCGSQAHVTGLSWVPILLSSPNLSNLLYSSKYHGLLRKQVRQHCLFYSLL